MIRFCVFCVGVFFLSGCGADKFLNKLLEPTPEKKQSTLHYDVLNSSPAASRDFSPKDLNESLALQNDLEDGIDLRVLAAWKRDLNGSSSCNGGAVTLRKPLVANLPSGTVAFRYTLEKRPQTAKFMIRVYHNVSSNFGYQIFGYDERGAFLDSIDNVNFPRLSFAFEVAPVSHRAIASFHDHRSVKVQMDSDRQILEGRLAQRASNMAPSISVEARLYTAGTDANRAQDFCEQNQLWVRIHSLQISSQEAALP